MAAPLKPPPDLMDRLHKLILMLSSDHAGERANAAAAIDRLLKDNGLDWHFLAAKMSGKEPAKPRPSHPPWETDDTPDVDMTWDDVPADETVHLQSDVVSDLIGQIERSARYLSPKSRNFLDSLHVRAKHYRSVRFSPKQLRWFGNLAVDAGVRPPWGLR